jgi:hypothetical protein
MARARETVAEKAEQIRELELKRLDRFQRSLQPAANKGDAKAVLAILKVMERRAKLLGLDAPTKQANTDSEGRDVAPVTVVFRPVTQADVQKALGDAQAGEVDAIRHPPDTVTE